MNKLEINTEECKYLLNGKPIEGAKEINIKITADNPPEAEITKVCELDVNLKDCDLTERYSNEDEKNIDEKLIILLCIYAII